MVLIWVSISWMLGIWVASRLETPLASWGILSLLPLSIAWMWRQTPRVRRAAVCGLFFCLGGLRYVLALPRVDKDSIVVHNDEGWATLTGVVVGEPDVRDRYVNLRVQAEELTHGSDAPVRVHGLVLVRAPRYPVPHYGDRIRASGELETPPTFETFSYRDYLARQGIYSTIAWARITTLGEGEGNALFAALLRCKARTQRAIADVLPEPPAALLTGILLGVESGLPPKLVADFQTTGTSHIIAISGFNMSIISLTLTRLSVRAVGRRYAAWFCTVVLALYTVFVGASAAVVRAAVMACVAAWGEHFGRQNSSANALFATALVMTAWNPNTLWDLGFLLSFAATLGLIALADPLSLRLLWLLARVVPRHWAETLSRLLDEPVVLTTCAQLTTLPIILATSGRLSPVTLLSNFMILPAQQQVMLWGALATGASLVWLPLGRVLGWVAWLFLAWTIGVVRRTAALAVVTPFASTIHVGYVVAWYGALGCVAWWLWQTEERRLMLRQRIGSWLRTNKVRKALLAGLGIAAALVWAAVLSLPDGKLHVTFLDVGAGDAAWIETPSGRQVIVNGGPSGTTMMAYLGQRMAFWDRAIDMVVLTDSTDAHALGVVPILERYQVSRLWLAPAAKGAGAAWERVGALAEARTIAVAEPLAGMRIEVGDGVVLTFVHPRARDGGEEGIVVLRVDYGTTCFLLSASADLPAEQAMVARGEELRCDVLQVSGQGNQNATSLPYLRAVQPALAVVSCASETEGTPDERALTRLDEAGATVVRTDESGSIEVISDGTGYEVRRHP
ncbi:MAG: ComEC/Rec2 family competence protein [Anaerolineae bacterium]